MKKFVFLSNSNLFKRELNGYERSMIDIIQGLPIINPEVSSSSVSLKFIEILT